jgi:hypothetical protein
MSNLRSGYKISLPFCITPGSPFNGRFSFTLDRELGSMIIHSASLAEKTSAELQNNHDYGLDIHTILSKTSEVFIRSFYPEKPGISIKCSFQSQYKAYLSSDSLYILCVYALKSLFRKAIAVHELIDWSIENLPLEHPSLVYALLQGGAFWYTNNEICHRVYVPKGFYGGIAKNEISLSRIDAKESVLPGFFMALNRTEIDMLYTIRLELPSTSKPLKSAFFAIPDMVMKDKLSLLLANNNDLVDQPGLLDPDLDNNKIIFAPISNIGVHKC